MKLHEMIQFKNIDLPDFLPNVRARCLEWAKEVVASNNAPHPFLKHRQRQHHIINEAVNRLDYKTIEEIVGIRKCRLLKQRAFQMIREYGDVNRIIIEQYDVPDVMSEYVKSEMNKTFGIPEDECMPIVQIQDGGEILHPHHGHGRKASIYCLLQGGGEVTKWYRQTDYFEIVDEFHIPDISKLEVSTETILQENQWSLFNHRDWHSVHRTSDVGVRINFGIDFKTMNVDQAMEYFK